MAEVVTAAELDALQGVYANTKAKTRPKDDNYVAGISAMDIVKSSNGKIQARVKVIILTEGDYFESPEYIYYNIGDEEGLAYFKGFCAVVGCELPEKFSDIQPAIAEFAAKFDGKIKITIKTNKENFRNIFVNGLHTDVV